MQKWQKLSCYLLLLSAACVSAQQSPCPNIFQYEYDGNSWIGIIRIPTSSFGTTIKILLTMALEASLPDTSQVGNIILANDNQDEVLNQIMQGEIITYNVLFPIPSPIPKVTSLLINDVEYCPGPTVQTSPESPIVTTLQIKHDLSVSNNNNNPPRNPQQPPNSFYRPTPNPIQGRPPANVPSRLVVSQDTQCGVAGAITNSLITGGEVTEPGDWPWLSAMYETDKKSNLKFICSGSLISQNTVVTAAHCLVVGKNRKRDVILKLGIYNVLNWTEPNQKIVQVTNTIIHPNYDTTYHHNDIALLKFNNVEYTRFIKPICLWQGDQNIKMVVNLEGTVVGWGKDENNNLVVPEPKKAKARIVSTDNCRNEVPDLISFLTDKTLCAGNRDGSGPCNGDSGGGLYIFRNRRWILRGIVSNSLIGPNGEVCHNQDYVVYTDSAKYLDWIERSLS